jgi:hypothetical protein
MLRLYMLMMVFPHGKLVHADGLLFTRVTGIAS